MKSNIPASKNAIVMKFFLPNFLYSMRTAISIGAGSSLKAEIAIFFKSYCSSSPPPESPLSVLGNKKTIP